MSNLLRRFRNSSQFHKTSTSKPEDASTQTHQPPANLPRPSTDNHSDWHAYWCGQGQPWRTEPEISPGRQEELAQRRAIVANIKEGIYPFKDVRLSRADVEWLIATHDGGQEPVDWSEAQQPERKGIDLRGANLRQVDLGHLPLTFMLGGLNWRERYRTPEHRDRAAVHLEGAILSWAHLEGAELYMAHLEKADLYMAHFEGALLRKAHLEGASLRMVHLEGKLPAIHNKKRGRKWRKQNIPVILPPADLRAAFFNSETDLRSIILGDERHGVVRLADVHWESVNLAVVDWAPVKMLGDERRARRKLDETGKVKDKEAQINDYREAVRANRQLAVALYSQGLNEEGVRFGYRAQLLQRQVLQRQGKLGAYIFSTFLDLLTGYGYKPARSIIAYLIVIASFATAYYVLGQTVGPHLSALSALIFSMTSFHGRGFFPGGIRLDDPLTAIAAFEAVVGLAIEISFIATFTQRFFGK